MTEPKTIDTLENLSKLIRYWVLQSTHQAGSGHPTSALSAVELMTGLLFGSNFKYDVANPDDVNNDRLIFSKGHASPLLYALWAAADQVPADHLASYREFGSVLEGHPTPRFPYTEAATGSLGQGLSIGVGMALNAKHLDTMSYRTFVLLGDSEMAEGSQWEAIQIAARYRLDNLVGILDVNRLGQRGETMYGHNLDAYRKRLEAFDWDTIIVEDGHNLKEVLAAYDRAESANGPVMIIARTVKGKGVSFLEDENGWHGKALDEEKLQQAFSELGEIDKDLRGSVKRPERQTPILSASESASPPNYDPGKKVATRNAYGNAITRLATQYPELVALDGEVCNSTRSEFFRDEYPERFFEMFIAEQNMVGAAIGMSLRGKKPFVSTFAAFFTRAFDQIRMGQYSDTNIKFVGSHAGVSIGQDGPSQMGLEDIGMFRMIENSLVLYPADAYATERLVEEMLRYNGISYLRTTRGKTPILYDENEEFHAGGSKVLKQDERDEVTIVAAGITVFEALKAHDILLEQGIHSRVIDLYSVKPIDRETLLQAAADTALVVTVEDHRPEGGIGEAVCAAVSDEDTPLEILAVNRRPRSGASDKQLDFQGLSAEGIVSCVMKRLVGRIGGTAGSADEHREDAILPG